MPLDYRSELRRPVTLALVAVAILGWLVVSVLVIVQSQNRSPSWRKSDKQTRNRRTSENQEVDCRIAGPASGVIGANIARRNICQ